VAAKSDKWLDIGLLILRIGIGLILLYYGSRKLFPVLGGPGFQGQLNTWEVQRNIPRWLGILAIISEFAGGIAFLSGLFTRLAAFGVMCTMATAAFFGISRPGAIDGLGRGDSQVLSQVFYPMTLMFVALAIIFTGAGAFSLDRKLFKKGR
jgi:putative oxidoreductase